jgi:hypothetical protein
MFWLYQLVLNCGKVIYLAYLLRKTRGLKKSGNSAFGYSNRKREFLQWHGRNAVFGD